MNNDFHSALYQANLLYGVDISSDKFEEIGLIAWGLIGNKQTRLYKHCAEISCDDLSVTLPCNADIIEAVTYGFEDWNYTDNIKQFGDINSQFTEGYIEASKLFESPLYLSGKFAKYERMGDKLYFDRNYGAVNILYKGIMLDPDGLPYINDKEVLAISTYVAYVIKRKEGLMTMNSNILEMAQLLQQDWLKYCDNARVPEYLDQNDMNQILDAKSSWNRKVFNKSYKPIK